jgi:hypothetical protein
MRTLLILLIVSLLISACGMTQSPTASEISLIIPTPSDSHSDLDSHSDSQATPVYINTPATALAEEAEAITVTTEHEPELLLGVTDRGMNCPLISQIVAHVLEEEAGLSVGIIEYESAEALFASLVGSSDQKEIDLTFCFLDPDDRDYLKLYPTDLKQIGEAIWQAKASPEKLLIMVNSSVFVDIHEKYCLHDILPHLIFDDASFEEQDVDRWLERHGELLQSWGSCH